MFKMSFLYNKISILGNNRILPKLVRTVCNIQCKGADRDSVISKIPNSVHECVRWHNYNTLKKGIYCELLKLSILSFFLVTCEIIVLMQMSRIRWKERKVENELKSKSFEISFHKIAYFAIIFLLVAILIPLKLQ